MAKLNTHHQCKLTAHQQGKMAIITDNFHNVIIQLDQLQIESKNSKSLGWINLSNLLNESQNRLLQLWQ